MVVEAQQPEGMTLRLSEDEIDQWNNALNEVCHGFPVANFQAAIGIPKDRAAMLLERLQTLNPERPELIQAEELLAVRNALTTGLAQLEAHEFHTRMGFTVEEANQMRNALDALAGQMRRMKTA